MLRQELTAYETEALQVALLRKPQVALAHSMAGLLLYGSVSARYESPTALGAQFAARTGNCCISRLRWHTARRTRACTPSLICCASVCQQTPRR